MKARSSNRNKFPPPNSFIESLFIACESGDFNFVSRELSTTSHDVKTFRNASMQDLLDTSIAHGHLNICKYLIDYGFNLNNRLEGSLLVAVKTHDVKTSRFIASQIPVNQVIDFDASLKYAISNGLVDIVDMFLSAFNLDLQQSLHDASLEGHIPVIKLLLDANADVNAIVPRRPGTYCLPLHAAIARGHLDVVAFLLQSGASLLTGLQEYDRVLFAWGNVHESLFCSLAEGGNAGLIQTALSSLPYHDKAVLARSLVIAAKAGHAAVVRVLLSVDALRADAWRSHLSEALRLALTRGHEDTAQELISAVAVAYVDPDANRHTLLMCAAEGGCVSMVEKLIADGASVNAVDLEKQTALSLASDPEVIRLLLDANAEVDRDTVNPALLGACRKSQPESVRMLLEVNAPVNVYPSLLTEALRPLPPGMPVGNKLEVLSLLLGAGVDPRVMNYGNSALHSCAMSHKADQADVIDAAGLLLDHDPGLLELCDHRGFTALALAAEKSSVGMVRFLISRSADVNARDLTGRSVLAVAVDDPSFGTDPGAVRKTVQALLKAGADPAAGSAGCQSLLMRLVAKSQRDSLLDDAASAAVVGDIANAMGMEMTEKKP